MTIEEKITYYKESLDCFEDAMDKYKFLLDQGKNAKPFPRNSFWTILMHNNHQIREHT